MFKKICILLFLIIFNLSFSKDTKGAKMKIPDNIKKTIEQGEYLSAQKMLLELSEKEKDTNLKEYYIIQTEILDRIKSDFKKNEETIFEELKKEIPNVSIDDMKRWNAEGKLEGKMIDGKMMYFNRAVGNLFILSSEARERRDAVKKNEEEKIRAQQALTDPGDASKTFDYDRYMRIVIDEGKKTGENFVFPTKWHIDYTLTVKPDLVPVGETIKCWLPFPRNNGYNRDIKIISTEPEAKIIAPEEALQRTLYFEKKVNPEDQGTSISFKMSLELTTYAFTAQIDPSKIQKYDRKSAVYKEFTKEKYPHLVFTDDLKKIAKEIVGKEKNPYLKAKKIFEWMDKNIPWTGAIEYSTIPNISEYCLKNRRGDCGIQSLLFIVLCRIEGIPAKWQSGWSLLPGRENLHDWAMFYVEPYGWLTVDPSRGLRKNTDEEVKWFFFGNNDAFRFICCDDFSMELNPPKKYFRSEPVDFQRGEVEWSGANLYFDKWTYDRVVKNITPLP